MINNNRGPPGGALTGFAGSVPFIFYRRCDVTNGFRENEIVRVQKVSIGTELVDYVIDHYAVVRASIETTKGRFTATGTSSAARDPKLSDSLIELAETRSVARALRFAGVGVETVGFEELGAGPVLEGTAPRQIADTTHDGSRVQNNHRTSGNGHHTPATSAQKRAIVSLAHKLGMEPDDAVAKVFQGIGFDDLSLGQASQLIDKMRAKAGNGGNGQTVQDRR
ncbi:MAG: hypothetical protein HY815_29030 [Candidatus Riflebacteria bacterium]|nr:hypothetical protein [Candidatus Riflebacteria bacterium]